MPESDGRHAGVTDGHVVEELRVSVAIADGEEHRRPARIQLHLEPLRSHLSCLVEESAGPRERHVLPLDVVHGRVDAGVILEQTQPVAELPLRAGLGLQLRAVRLQVEVRLERRRVLRVEVQAAGRLIDEAVARGGALLNALGHGADAFHAVHHRVVVGAAIDVVEAAENHRLHLRSRSRCGPAGTTPSV